MSGVVVIDQELLKSNAFRSLNGTAKTVYLDFLMKRKMKQVKMAGGIKVPMILNNGQLQYSYQEALQRGITKPAFVRSIDTLIAHGLIDISRPGSGGKQRDVSLYGISERWRKYGTPEFNPGKARVKDIRQGRGFSVMWNRRRKEEFEAIFGNDFVTGFSNDFVTPKKDFEGDSNVSCNENVTPIKARKRRKGASLLA